MGFIVLLTHSAFAASGDDRGASDSWASTLIGFLPIVIFLVILFYYFRSQKNSPAAKLQQEYVERQIQHTRRLEELLERIAVALEKK